MPAFVSAKTAFISIVAAGTLAAISGCAATKDAHPSPLGDSLSIAEGASSSTPQTQVASAGGVNPSGSGSTNSSTDTGAGTRSASSTPSKTGKDSVAKDPPITVPTVKGRTRRDSLELVKAVKEGMKSTGWPVKTAPALPGSILPSHRIVAYYGNPLSKKMGILGELPPDQMLARFDKEIAAWQKADPSHPVQPALHLIAVVAQGAPGRDGKYRLRMTDSLINMVHGWAQKKHAILILDVQVGQSTVQEELPRLIPFLKQPDIMLGIDPEFSMKGGEKPGTKIGTMNSSDVNFAINLLAGLVTQYRLPPKVLIVHRFTRPMLKDAKGIKLDPRVQVVINMDGWGQPWLKYDSYSSYVTDEPVQFTGFKLFYHNDTKKGDPLLTPPEVLMLYPKPLYIQYQ
jgi:hypothetical protein